MGPMSEIGLHPVKGNGGERALVTLSGIAIGAMALIICISIISRIFGVTIVPEPVLLIQELMVIVVVMPLSILVCERSHISVTFFTEKMQGRGLLALSIVSNIVGLFFSTFVAYSAYLLFEKSFASGEYYNGTIEIPHWFGKFIFMAGFTAFAIRLLYMIFADTKTLLKSK